VTSPRILFPTNNQYYTVACVVVFTSKLISSSNDESSPRRGPYNPNSRTILTWLKNQNSPNIQLLSQWPFTALPPTQQHSHPADLEAALGPSGFLH
jgi:hypothetical protein